MVFALCSALSCQLNGRMAKRVTCSAPVNIAVVKYWGKRDEEKILPINSSLSVTLSQEQLRTKTTVAISKDFTEDKMWLNGEEHSMASKRLQNVLAQVRRLARGKRKLDASEEDDDNDWRAWHIRVCSVNNFPTAAGLASSAAGFSCLVFTLSKLFGLDGDVTSLARVGSGSACRSLYGGFVAWNMGREADGTDSVAEQIEPESHWPQMRALILVASDQKKDVSSTSGMETSVLTSRLLQHRASSVVPERMVAMVDAIRRKDFATFATETMKDSNQFHATCLDTYPPIFYLNDVSRRVIHFVHRYNEHRGKPHVAYTFDAGPNACLYLLESDVADVLSLLLHYFPPATDGIDVHEQPFVRGLLVHHQAPDQKFISAYSVKPMIGSIKYIISTGVGPGPQVLADSESLLDDCNLPLVTESCNGDADHE